MGAGNGDGGGWGGLGHPRFSSPAPTGKVTSTLRLSSSTCPQHPKVKRRGYKAGDGVTPSRPAPNFPTKPFSGPLGPGLTRCCRSAAERPPRYAAMHPTMRRGAGRERLRGWRRGARACARLRPVPRAPAPACLQQPLSRDSRASSRAAPPELARRKAWPSPHLSGAVRGAKFKGQGPIRWSAGTAGTRARRERRGRDPEMGVWYQ